MSKIKEEKKMCKKKKSKLGGKIVLIGGTVLGIAAFAVLPGVIASKVSLDDVFDTEDN